VEFATPEAQVAARRLVPDFFRKHQPQLSRANCAGVTVESGVDPAILRKPCTPSWSTPTAEFLARQPRDPGKLLAVLRTPEPVPVPQSRPPLPADELAFIRIGTALDSGLVPSDLRAALYQAARRLPGIKLLNDVVTVDGRHGRAVGYTTAQGQRLDIIISPADGTSIGSRLVEPNGDVYSATALTRQLTSTVPR